MQLNYSRIALRMFTERILENTFPDETGAARLQQAGLFLLIYVLQSDKEPVTISRLEKITGQADAGIIRQVNKLISIGVVEKTQILNKQGRGRAFHLSIKESAMTRRLTSAIEKSGAKKKR
jgi:predicted transcriptional regulator